jgi:hypothetical protein
MSTQTMKSTIGWLHLIRCAAWGISKLGHPSEFRLQRKQWIWRKQHIITWQKHVKSDDVAFVHPGSWYLWSFTPPRQACFWE